MLGHLPGDRTHDVERVKTRDARTRLRNLDARIGEPEPVGRGPDSQSQQQPLGASAILLHDEPGIERHAQLVVEHHRIFVGAFGKHSLGEAGDEHDAEGASSRLVWAPHEYAAISVLGRIDFHRQQAVRDHVPCFIEWHRTDGAHRPQLLDHPQHAVGLAKDHRGQHREAIEPFPPCRGRRPRRQQIDDRQGECAQVAQVSPVALETGRSRRLGILFAFLRDANAKLLGQPIQPPMPPRRIAADDRRFDDQRFPLPRSPQHPVHDGFVVGIRGARRLGRAGRFDVRVFVPAGVFSIGLRRCVGDRAQRLIVRHEKLPRACLVVERRYLGEREVFGKPARGQAFAGACENREKGAAGGVRTPSAALEPCRNARSTERVLEQADVTLRCPQEHRHLVESHARTSLLENSASDLHALSSFARRREKRHIAVRAANGRLAGGKQVAA